MTTGKKILIGCMSFFVLFFLGIVGIFVLAFWGTSGLTKVADEQLAALRSGDYAQAYAFTSSDFQQTTSLDQFKAFVDSYPELESNESSSFLNRKLENDEGTLEGNLKAQDGTITPVIYHLVKQKGVWKIQSVQIDQQDPKSTEKPSSSSTTFEQAETVVKTSVQEIRVNETAGLDGYVVEHQDEFSTETQEILVSAYIQDAKPGDQVQATLIYGATGQNIGPATNTIVNQGDIVSSFSFTKPSDGWPVGGYRIVIKLTDGQTKAAQFSVK